MCGCFFAHSVRQYIAPQPHFNQVSGVLFSILSICTKYKIRNLENRNSETHLSPPSKTETMQWINQYFFQSACTCLLKPAGGRRYITQPGCQIHNVQTTFNISPAEEKKNLRVMPVVCVLCLKRDTNHKPLLTNPPPPFTCIIYIYYYIFKTFRATINTFIHIQSLRRNTDNRGRSPSLWDCELHRLILVSYSQFWFNSWNIYFNVWISHNWNKWFAHVFSMSQKLTSHFNSRDICM